MDYIHFLNLQYLFYQLYLLLTGGVSVDGNALLIMVAYLWGWFTFVSFFVSLLLLVLTIYAIRKTWELERLDEEKFGTVHGPLFEREKKNARWEQILKHSESENPNDWRLAIIEADIVLDEMVKSMGYHGDSLGERLKHVEQSDFNSIEAAWEAHKIRNRIAHSGADFILTQREARRVISLYRQVFEEFEYI